MSLIKGTNVRAGIRPGDTADTYDTHDSQYGLGGWREVATTAARDSIPAPRRREGMCVRVVANGIEYLLGDDLTTWTAKPSGGGHIIQGADGVPVAQESVLEFQGLSVSPGAGKTIISLDIVEGNWV